MKNLLKVPMFTHQSEALDFHIKSKYSINGFEMGLGKSLIGIALSESVATNTLIVCPAYLKLHWQCEINEFSFKKSNIDVVSYNKLKSISKDYDCIIFDEAHYLKNIKAKRTNEAHALVKKINPNYLLLLTGTPVKNRVPEWFSLIKLCDYYHKQSTFSNFSYNYDAFCTTFSNVQRVQMRGFVLNRYYGVKNKSELIDILKPIYLRRATEGLPDQISKFVEVEPDIKSKEMKALEEALRADFQDANNLSTAKKQNAILKVPHTIEYVKEFIDQDTRCIVFTDHVDSCKAIADYFKVTPLTGEVSAEKRAQAVKEFEALKTNLLVCTIGSMSTGFSITSANQMVFNDTPWVPADLAQAKGRIRRITQKKTCFYHFMFSSAIDKMIYKTLVSKMKDIKEATDV